MGPYITIAPGSINVDLILKTDVLRGPKTFRGKYAESQGGKGSNQAVAARRASADGREIRIDQEASGFAITADLISPEPQGG